MLADFGYMICSDANLLSSDIIDKYVAVIIGIKNINIIIQNLNEDSQRKNVKN